MGQAPLGLPPAAWQSMSLAAGKVPAHPLLMGMQPMLLPSPGSGIPNVVVVPRLLLPSVFHSAGLQPTLLPLPSSQHITLPHTQVASSSSQPAAVSIPDIRWPLVPPAISINSSEADQAAATQQLTTAQDEAGKQLPARSHQAGRAVGASPTHPAATTLPASPEPAADAAEAAQQKPLQPAAGPYSLRVLADAALGSQALERRQGQQQAPAVLGLQLHTASSGPTASQAAANHCSTPAPQSVLNAAWLPSRSSDRPTAFTPWVPSWQSRPAPHRSHTDPSPMQHSVPEPRAISLPEPLWTSTGGSSVIRPKARAATSATNLLSAQLVGEALQASAHLERSGFKATRAPSFRQEAFLPCKRQRAQAG